jgi:SAM-dependent methyltransferase
LAAPLLFNAVVEYPLVLVLACLFRPATPDGESLPAPEHKSGRERKRVAATETPTPRPTDSLKLDIGLPVLLGLVTIGLVEVIQAIGPAQHQVRVGLMFGPSALVCYTFLHRPLRFGLGIGALLLAGAFHEGIHGRTLYRERSFFGVHRVTLDPGGRFRELVHGNTVHGRQSLDPTRAREPLTYYHRTGPIGQVFAEFSGPAAKPRVAIVGLGAGSLAAYGESGQHVTYYEIDPTVVSIAQDSGYFTFLKDSQAQVEMVLGDARLTLRTAPTGHYGLIVMDAFSSDAIPLHLLTREALREYKSKLAEDGLLAFNISNRYLDLEPVLGDLAQDANLVSWTRQDLETSPSEEQEGKSPSQWVVMARRKEHLGKLTQDTRWREVKGRRDRAAVWTDDFSNLFSVFKWD